LGLKIPTILLLFLCGIPKAQARAMLLVGEPYGYDGTYAGTGHAAVYLSGVCTISPVVLRLCAKGETGIVLSRYSGIRGYDWIAIPLTPYLYAVKESEDIPLLADDKLVAFLRDRYRRDHLLSLVPDLPNGGTPDGDWYELLGASYLRTIYAFEIETSVDQDLKFIQMLNGKSNRQRWKLITANCADFAREIIDFYYPHAVHRGIIGDLGVTTPKQLARTLTSHARHHPQLQISRFVIPQVPGTISRSKRLRGVLEVMLTSKKYMLPVFLFHPYAGAIAVAVCVGHWHFNPGKNAAILDSNRQLRAALKRPDQRVVQYRLQELILAASSGGNTDERQWTSLRAAGIPALDASGHPVLQLLRGGEVTTVGLTRSNILTVASRSEFAAGLVEARLREELKSTAALKTAQSDVESDLVLLQQLLARPETGLARTVPDFAAENSVPRAVSVR